MLPIVTSKLRHLIIRKFEINTLNHKAQSLILTFLGYASLVRSLTILSDTFLILFVLDAVGYAAAGILVAIRIIVQAVFDYPTGILSDRIGQKLVLTMSYSFFAISYMLFSQSTSYNQFILAYVFFALGTAQQSGTLQTWFDNNYRHLTTIHDPDRVTYKIFTGKARTLIDLWGALFLIIGGILATYISRAYVFRLQVVGMIILIIATWIYIGNYIEPSSITETRKSYLSLLSEGVTSIFQSKDLMLLVSAAIIFQVGLSIWGDLVIFPLYFGYTGTDLGASIFRFTLFLLGSLSLWLIANRVGQTSPYTWLPRIHLIHTIFFYGCLASLFIFIPLTNEFNPWGILFGGLLIFISHMLRVVIYIWIQQIYLDLIPDHRRNGFYSLVPTVVLFAQAPFTIGSGYLIESEGFIWLSIFLGLMTLISTGLYYKAMKSLKTAQFNENIARFVG